MNPRLRTAFGLIELLVTLAVMAIFVTLIMPKFFEIQTNARKEVVKSQADAIRRAIQIWMSTQDTTYEIADKFDGTTVGDITFMGNTTWQNEISPHLEDGFVDAAELTFNTASNGYITSLQSKELEVGGALSIAGAQASPWGSVPRASSTTAHIRVVWAADDADRYNSSPTVLVFLPEEITIE